MPDLTLQFDLHVVTNSDGVAINSNGEPIGDPDDWEYVPVLTDSHGPQGELDDDKKAFHSPQGWRNPDEPDGPLIRGHVYNVNSTPAGDHWQFSSFPNDILDQPE